MRLAAVNEFHTSILDRAYLDLFIPKWEGSFAHWLAVGALKNVTQSQGYAHKEEGGRRQEGKGVGELNSICVLAIKTRSTIIKMRRVFVVAISTQCAALSVCVCVCVPSMEHILIAIRFRIPITIPIPSPIPIPFLLSFSLSRRLFWGSVPLRFCVCVGRLRLCK